MSKNLAFTAVLLAGGLQAATLVPRSCPDPKDDQWMIGCEVLDRDFAKFSAYKDYLPKLGIRSIRLQGGWAKCEKEKGKYDFSWLDEPVDFALAHGLRPTTAIRSTRAAADATSPPASRTVKRALRPGTAGWTRCRSISRDAYGTGRCGTSPTSAGTSR